MNPAVQSTLIWAVLALIVILTGFRYFARPLIRAIDAWGMQHARTAAQADAAAQAELTQVAERRDELALRQATLSERTAAERARLVTETAQYQIDADAARETLEEAVTARRQVLAARADAEAALAPELARSALDGTRDVELRSLIEAYTAYCEACNGVPAGFSYWLGNFNGLRD